MADSNRRTREAICERCGRPVGDGAYCCTPCVSQTKINLEFIAENDGELDVTLTRQDRVSAGTGGRASAETPLPVNLRASDLAHRLRGKLTTWTRVVLDARGITAEEAFADPDRPAGPICGRGTWCAHPSCRAIAIRREITNADMACWLAERVNWMAHRDWSPQAFDDFGALAVDLARAIDSPPPMIALGTCDTEGCEGELRAHHEAVFTHCPDCETSYDVAKRRDQLLARADHRKFNAASIARILTALGDTDPDGRPIVRDAKWVYNRVQWKQLTPVRLPNGDKARDDAGRPLYRLGDARRLHDQDIQQAQQKQHAKAAA